MRTLLVAVATLFALVETAAALPAPTGGVGTLRPSITDARPIEPACSGCGCRGGAGYRLPSGKCAPRRP